MRKKSTHIRVKPEDKLKWDEYKQGLGKTSPDLFNTILASKELNLDQRVYLEALKKQQKLKFKLGI